jgi:hypothetical protein
VPGRPRGRRAAAVAAGFAGTVLMGCRFETLVDEAFWSWRRTSELAGEAGAGATLVPAPLRERGSPTPIASVAMGLDGGI